jgi:hypothetical protein
MKFLDFLFKKHKKQPVSIVKPKRIFYEVNSSKSSEQLFIEVAKLCARGNCYIDLKGTKIKGLTLVINSDVQLVNGLIEVIIPITWYPKAENIFISGNYITLVSSNED